MATPHFPEALRAITERVISDIHNFTHNPSALFAPDIDELMARTAPTYERLRMHRFYLLNSAVLTAFGVYHYIPCSVEHATAWLTTCVCDHSSGQVDGETCRVCQGTGFPWESTIGYPETATALEDLCGLPEGCIPVQRRTITMVPGDAALVFRLVFPQGTRPDPALKGHLGREFLMQHHELGMLTRVE